MICGAMYCHAAVGDTFNKTYGSYSVTYKIISENPNEVSVKKVSVTSSPEVTIPASITNESLTYNVTAIADLACSNEVNIPKITFPDAITSIGKEAFNCCYALTEFTIPASVKTISNGAFQNCRSITSFTIPAAVTQIGRYNVFLLNTSLTAINVDAANTTYSSHNGVLFSKDKKTLLRFPDGKSQTYAVPNFVDTIGTDAFRHNTKIKSVIISDSVTHIAPAAFFQSDVESITMGKGITYIGDNGFRMCNNLGEFVCHVEEPSSITTGNYIFLDVKTDSCILRVPEGCVEKYKNIYPWKKFTNIVEIEPVVGNRFEKDGIMYEITSLTPNEVKVIYKDPLYTGVITIPASVDKGRTYNVTAIGDAAFANCSEVTAINIPNSVNSIRMGAFKGCTKLTSIVIPNQVTVINTLTFANCGLTSFTIPQNITKIGSGAFSDCTALSKIISNIENPDNVTLGTTVFKNIAVTTCKLKVPAGTVNVYKAAAQWKDFLNIEEYISGISSVETLPFTAYVQGNKLIIENAAGKSVNIYNVTGQLINYELKVTNHETIDLPQAGIYLVKVGDNATKVVVK